MRKIPTTGSMRMTLRDHFAGQVVAKCYSECTDDQTFVGNSKELCGDSWEKATMAQVVSAMAYHIADAMLEERKKNK